MRQLEKSSEQGFWCIPSRIRGSESKVVLWPGLPVEEAVRRRAGDRSECSSRRGGLESESGRCSSSARPPGRRFDRPSSLSFRYLDRPMSCVFVYLDRAFVGRPVREGPRVYEPDNLPIPKTKKSGLYDPIISVYNQEIQKDPFLIQNPDSIITI